MNSNEYDYLLKIVMVGDSGVGKSCALLRYVDNIYTDNYISTIGVDFKIKTVTYNGKLIKYQIWDTAGQERFRTITYSYYRGSHFIILCFDLTNMESFENLKYWYSEVKNYTTDAHILLVGMKSDLINKQVVSQIMINEFCTQCSSLSGEKLEYIKISSKTNEGVDDIFNIVNRLGLDNINNLSTRLLEPTTIGSSVPVKPKTSCC